MISRRKFLKHSALMLTGIAAPSLSPQLVKHGRVSTAYADSSIPSAEWLANYLAALDLPQIAPLNDAFDSIRNKEGSRSILIYDIYNNHLLTALKTEAPMPIASSFKGPLLFYFLDQIDSSIWNELPIEYWSITNQEAIPSSYLPAWSKHINILNNLFRAVVLSDNESAGRVFAYVANAKNAENPIALFNDWSHDVVGTSQMSSMSAWSDGIPREMPTIDNRFLGRIAILNHQMVPFNNVMTARDLGLYYIWWQSRMSIDAKQVGQRLLSWIHEEQRSNIEKMAFALNGVAYSKNGSLSRVETGVTTVVTDGGLVDIPDRGLFLVVFLSGNADTRTPTYFEHITEIIAGDHDDLVAAYEAAHSLEIEQIRFNEQLLLENYASTSEIYANQWNYAFLKYEGIDVYQSPNEAQPIRNPLITASRFGVHLLMQGAMIRYLPVDDEWVRLIPDSERDNVQLRLGEPIYVRRRNLHPISTTYGATIPYLVNPDITSDDKLVVIDITRREMTLLERDLAIIKTPIVLNDIDTPRGGHVTYTRWLACSMQPWAPGVPFTTYFHVDGFAIHGSPWQRWEQTVTAENIGQRTSAGCVNVPNWKITIGQYTRPLDEIVFRWLGGVQNPENYVYEYGSKAHPMVRIYLVDYLEDLDNYHRPPKLAGEGITWEDIRSSVKTAPTTAPSSFF